MASFIDRVLKNTRPIISNDDLRSMHSEQSVEFLGAKQPGAGAGVGGPGPGGGDVDYKLWQSHRQQSFTSINSANSLDSNSHDQELTEARRTFSSTASLPFTRSQESWWWWSNFLYQFELRDDVQNVVNQYRKRLARFLEHHVTISHLPVTIVHERIFMLLEIYSKLSAHAVDDSIN